MSRANRFVVILKRVDRHYSAYVPDLPGCVAIGDNVAVVEREIRDRILQHLDDLRQNGQPIPPSSSLAIYVEA